MPRPYIVGAPRPYLIVGGGGPARSAASLAQSRLAGIVSVLQQAVADGRLAREDAAELLAAEMRTSAAGPAREFLDGSSRSNPLGSLEIGEATVGESASRARQRRDAWLAGATGAPSSTPDRAAPWPFGKYDLVMAPEGQRGAPRTFDELPTWTQPQYEAWLKLQPGYVPQEERRREPLPPEGNNNAPAPPVAPKLELFPMEPKKPKIGTTTLPGGDESGPTGASFVPLGVPTWLLGHQRARPVTVNPGPRPSGEFNPGAVQESRLRRRLADEPEQGVGQLATIRRQGIGPGPDVRPVAVASLAMPRGTFRVG